VCVRLGVAWSRFRQRDDIEKNGGHDMILTDSRQRPNSGARSISLLLALMLWLVISAAPAQDSCGRPLCQAGERYRADDSSSVNFGWCYTERLTYVAHQRRECPAGTTLDRALGTCVRPDCCPEQPLCRADETYTRSGTSGGRTYGICNTRASVTGASANRLAYCADGWQLETATGVCKKICPKVTGTIKGPAPPVVSGDPKVSGTVKGPPAPVAAPGVSKGGKADLVVRSLGLASVGECRAGAVVLTFRVKVANAGAVRSPALPGRARLEAKEPRRGWGGGVDLPAIEPGAMVELQVPVSYFSADPGFMKSGAPHAFRATVDSLGAIDEADETNNKSAPHSTSAPPGCK
jgi:hypothetical protein